MYKFKMAKPYLLFFVVFAFGANNYANADGHSKKQLVPINGIGEAVSEKDLVKWDISVYFDGENLPEGSGTLTEGEEIWSAQCAMCHGDFGEGANGYPKMFAAEREDFIKSAVEDGFNVESRGINNMWGDAPTLYDMIRRAMPYFAPQSLSADQAYSVTGYALYLADIISDDVEIIDAELLKNITMPTADLYYTDTRPDVTNERCMSDCRSEDPQVIGKLIVGDFDGIQDDEEGQ